MFKSILAMFAIAIAVSGCKTYDDGSISPEVEALIDRSMTGMLVIEGGEFMMGDVGINVKEDDGKTYFYYWDVSTNSRPLHPVRLSAFKIAKHEVIYEDFDVFLSQTDRPVKYLEKFKWADNLPAAADWYDAKAYCQWLGSVSDQSVDLPTEAQWEYAARSRGRPVGFATDDGTIKKGKNYHDFRRKLSPVARFPPNPIGLYDMSGNSAEWVDDWYLDNYYAATPVDDPPGPMTGTHKILRGGSIYNSPAFSNVYGRSPVPIDFLAKSSERLRFVNKHFGFRCVINSGLAVQKGNNNRLAYKP